MKIHLTIIKLSLTSYSIIILFELSKTSYSTRDHPIIISFKPSVLTYEKPNDQNFKLYKNSFFANYEGFIYYQNNLSEEFNDDCCHLNFDSIDYRFF
jgi:hypothetical protein